MEWVTEQSGIDVDGSPIRRTFLRFGMSPVMPDAEPASKPRRVDCVGADGSRSVYSYRMGRMMGISGG